MAVARLSTLQLLLWLLSQSSLNYARRQVLLDSDLVLVRGTCAQRIDLAQATGRSARMTTALRTVYVLDDAKLAGELQQNFGSSMNETYLDWPDRPDPLKPGDSRVAMAPWLAHAALGDTYKWLLYGDDGGVDMAHGGHVGNKADARGSWGAAEVGLF